MSYKKLIPNIYLKDEKAYADKDLSVLLGNGDAVAAANRFSENGADEILVMDLSYDDDSHERQSVFCARLPNLLIHRYL